MNPNHLEVFIGPYGQRHRLFDDLNPTLWSETDGVLEMFCYDYEYGKRFRYTGEEVPKLTTVWRLENYPVDPVLETKVVELAADGFMDLEIHRILRRPLAEIAAIMTFHGYDPIQLDRKWDPDSRRGRYYAPAHSAASS